MLEDQIIRNDYFALSKPEKEQWLLEQCLLLLRYQYQNCKEYRQFMDNQYAKTTISQDENDDLSCLSEQSRRLECIVRKTKSLALKGAYRRLKFVVAVMHKAHNDGGFGWSFRYPTDN
jgi:hypothetical protein